jgi:hypothetical protein
VGTIQVNSFSVEDILKSLANQEWAVPLFQREFVWSPRDVSLLADSILKGRPIGISTLWKITNDMAADLGTESINIIFKDEKVSFSQQRSAGQQLAILDGRQRCTAIAMAFGGLKITSAKSQYNGSYFLHLDSHEDDEWVVYLKEKDIEKRGFTTVSSCLANGYLPLEVKADSSGNRKIGTDWMSQVQNLLKVEEIFPKNELPKQEVLDQRIQRLTAATDGINKTRLAIYELGPEFALSDICEIFETLNQTGIRVSTADLLHTILFQKTANHAKQFNLRDWLDEIGEDNGVRGWSSSTDKPERVAQFATTTYIAQVDKIVVPDLTNRALKASPVTTIKAKDILATPSEHWVAIRDHETEFKEAIAKFQMVVANGYFPSSKCPYPAMAAIYVGLHWTKAVENHDLDKSWTLQDLGVVFRAYFWRSALSQRFDQGMLSKVTADMSELRTILRGKTDHADPNSWYKWASSELDKIIKPEDVPSGEVILSWVLDGDVKGARSQAVRLLPLARTTLDIVMHKSIDVTIEGNAELHHIWPKAWIAKNMSGSVKEFIDEAKLLKEDRINSAANMTPLTPETNNFWKDKKPSVALGERNSKFSRAREVFEDAYIDETSYGFLVSEDEAAFKDFLTHRASLISTDICRRLNLYPGA